MSDANKVDKETQQKNARLGLLLGAFVVSTILLAIYNFYNHGLPKDPNRMRERFQKQSAMKAEAEAKALQSRQDKQHQSQSEDAK